MERWLHIRMEEYRDTMLQSLEDNVLTTGKDSAERSYALAGLHMCKEGWAKFEKCITVAEKIDVATTAPENQLMALQKVAGAMRKQLKEQNRIATNVYRIIIGNIGDSTRTLDTIHAQLNREVQRVRDDLFTAQHAVELSELESKEFSLQDFLRLADYKLSHAAQRIFERKQESDRSTTGGGNMIEFELRLQQMTRDMQSQIARLEKQLEAEKQAATTHARNSRLELEELSKNHETTQREMKEKHAKETSALTASFQSEINTLTEDCEHRMEDLQRTFMHKMSEQQSNDSTNRQGAIESLRAAFADEKKATEERLRKLQEKREQEIEEQLAATKEDVHVTWEGESKETLVGLLQGRRSELDMMIASHKVQVKARTLEWESALRGVIEKYEKELKRAADDQKAQELTLMNLRKEKGSVESELMAKKRDIIVQREEYNTQIGDMIKEHEKELTGISRDYQRERASAIESKEKLDVAVEELSALRESSRESEKSMTETILQLRVLAERPMPTVPDQPKSTQTDKVYVYDAPKKLVSNVRAPGSTPRSAKKARSGGRRTPGPYDEDEGDVGANEESSSSLASPLFLTEDLLRRPAADEQWDGGDNGDEVSSQLTGVSPSVTPTPHSSKRRKKKGHPGKVSGKKIVDSSSSPAKGVKHSTSHHAPAATASDLSSDHPQVDNDLASEERHHQVSDGVLIAAQQPKSKDDNMQRTDMNDEENSVSVTATDIHAAETEENDTTVLQQNQQQDTADASGEDHGSAISNRLESHDDAKKNVMASEVNGAVQVVTTTTIRIPSTPKVQKSKFAAELMEKRRQQHAGGLSESARQRLDAVEESSAKSNNEVETEGQGGGVISEVVDVPISMMAPTMVQNYQVRGGDELLERRPLTVNDVCQLLLTKDRFTLLLCRLAVLSEYATSDAQRHVTAAEIKRLRATLPQRFAKELQIADRVRSVCPLDISAISHYLLMTVLPQTNVAASEMSTTGQQHHATDYLCNELRMQVEKAVEVVRNLELPLSLNEVSSVELAEYVAAVQEEEEVSSRGKRWGSSVPSLTQQDVSMIEHLKHFLTACVEIVVLTTKLSDIHQRRRRALSARNNSNNKNGDGSVDQAETENVDTELSAATVPSSPMMVITASRGGPPLPEGSSKGGMTSSSRRAPHSARPISHLVSAAEVQRAGKFNKAVAERWGSARAPARLPQIPTGGGGMSTSDATFEIRNSRSSGRR